MRSPNDRSHRRQRPPAAAHRHPPGDARRNDARRADARPNYALRRAIAAVLAAAFLLVAAVGAVSLTGLGGRPASASETGTATASFTARHLVAQPGDTLWSIAEAHHGDADLVTYVDRLIDLNGGTTILPGQSVRLP